jgi:hypothetical protein
VRGSYLGGLGVFSGRLGIRCLASHKRT